MSDTKKETHVDEFVDDYSKDSESEVYARWFLFLKRTPAIVQAHFHKFIEPLKLFASWKGKRYRVTGASRMGDVWITKNFEQDRGYEHRIDVAELTAFSDKP